MFPNGIPLRQKNQVFALQLSEAYAVSYPLGKSEGTTERNHPYQVYPPTLALALAKAAPRSQSFACPFAWPPVAVAPCTITFDYAICGPKLINPTNARPGKGRTRPSG